LQPTQLFLPDTLLNWPSALVTARFLPPSFRWQCHPSAVLEAINNIDKSF